jgi:ribosomal-protein-alanine N-acetyltransferase
MTPEALAALHARAFPGPPRPWTATEFGDLLADPQVALFTAGGAAFLLLRRAGPEAEVLTLCTDRAQRRNGHAAALLGQAEAWARDAGVEEILLEVAETNTAARALYARAGFAERGYRKSYYTQAGRAAVSALVLGKPLT